MPEVKLKLCPFCGEKAHIQEIDSVIFSICQCSACGPNGTSKEEVIEKWNKRTDGKIGHFVLRTGPMISVTKESFEKFVNAAKETAEMIERHIKPGHRYEFSLDQLKESIIEFK